MDERTNDLFKLSLAYAHRHPSATKYFDSFEDYVQELRLFVLEKMNKFDPDKGEFSTFCYLCFINRIRYQVRHYKRQPQTISIDTPVDSDEQLTIVDTIPDNSPSEDDILSNITDKMFIQKFIKCLSDETLMYFYFDLTHKQIAKITNRTHQNVSQKIIADLERVRKVLATGKLKLANRTNNVGKAEAYAKEHNCSIRTYYRKKKENNL